MGELSQLRQHHTRVILILKLFACLDQQDICLQRYKKLNQNHLRHMAFTIIKEIIIERHSNKSLRYQLLKSCLTAIMISKRVVFLIVFE